MKPHEIKFGKTYVNRGAGRTRRTVLAIGNKWRPDRWYGRPGHEPDEPGVLFQQGEGKDAFQDRLYLSSFATWAGREVRD